MANPYYNHTSGVPAVQTRGSSPNMRAEFDLVGAGFDSAYSQILAIAAAVGVAVTVTEFPLASNSTTDIGNGYGPVLLITGTNPITSFGANYKGAFFLRFQSSLLLTNSASLVLPGAANIMTNAGDACIAVPIGNPANGWRVMAYCRMSLGLIDDFAVRTSSTYADPAWLTQLGWSKITGRPTTLAGYGIIDAPQKDGTGATGTWPISITGNAATATTTDKATGSYLAAAGGTADAITATFSPNVTALTNGLRVRITGLSPNATTAPTLAAGTTAATAIKYFDASALLVGAIPAEADFVYSSTALAWLLQNPKVLPQPNGGTGYSLATRQVAQIVETSTSAVASGTTIIPLDDTIPQQTEGDQYLSLTITPKNASSTLLVEADISFANTTTAAIIVIGALFKDAGADALAASWVYGPGASTNWDGFITLRHVIPAGSTAAQTFKVRLGPHAAATLNVNGRAGARLFGTIPKSNIQITEYLP